MFTNLFCFSIPPFLQDDLFQAFVELSRLSHLRIISRVPITIGHLHALHLQYSRPGGVLSLPRLNNIRVANLVIYTSVSLQETFQEAELFNELLPFVAEVFCGLGCLSLTVLKGPITPDTPIDGPLTEQLSAKVKELFTGLDKFNSLFFIKNQ